MLYIQVRNENNQEIKFTSICQRQYSIVPIGHGIDSRCKAYHHISGRDGARRNPKPHHHEAEQCYMILEGNGVMEVDGEKAHIVASDTIFIHPTAFTACAMKVKRR